MSNIIERKSASRQGSNSAGKTGGKFVDNMRKLAQKRSASRSKAPLQIGNVLTKKALPKGTASFDSDVTKPEGDKGIPIKASKGQSALNPKQPGVI